jgi:hypothetical protein
MVATLACGIALGAVLTVAADSGTTPANSEIEALRSQVEALEARFLETTVGVIGRVPKLEARVAALEQRLAGQLPDPNGLTRRPSLHGSPVPENWSRRQFNGMPYYVIPLRHDPNSTARLRR